MVNFQVVSSFAPKGDQPKAIEQLTQGLKKEACQTLLGVTGSGKTFSIAHVIANYGKPVLFLTHNKTLAAQQYYELKELFPHNKVCYFVSYYDYYQPESYLPSSDTYIEKDSSINEKIEQLRLEATAALLSREDVIIVSSVSCIYNLGKPEEFSKGALRLVRGQEIKREEVFSALIKAQYERNDTEIRHGCFYVKGETLYISSGTGETTFRIDFFGDMIEKIYEIDPLNHEKIAELYEMVLFPAKHYMVDQNVQASALAQIRKELKTVSPKLPPIESFRLTQRTNYDLEMIEQLGYCKGIENYSRYFDGRLPGEPPYCLLDYFPKDFLLVIDESHVTLPQVGGMYEGDRSRKKNLIEYGFRLPSAYDNRPLKFTEFESYLNHVIFVSATPADYELRKSGQIVEQIVRPTGLIDPPIIIRKPEGQMDDLKKEILRVSKAGYRALVTTLTKKMSEVLTDYLQASGIKATYLHSEIETIERTKIITDLRLGVHEVLVGVNLLREGLDIPEVALVAILDADKEGFLRNARSLIQTVGRAARNVEGKAILYAEKITESMQTCIDETNRRREVQIAYNKQQKITPQSIKKAIRTQQFGGQIVEDEKLDRPQLIKQLDAEMLLAAEQLDFERAIELRDRIHRLKGKTEETFQKTKKKKV